MSSLTATAADLYKDVVGVDTHAATHSYAIVAASGALLDLIGQHGPVSRKPNLDRQASGPGVVSRVLSPFDPSGDLFR
jgi:hypothetical protein